MLAPRTISLAGAAGVQSFLRMKLHKNLSSSPLGSRRLGVLQSAVIASVLLLGAGYFLKFVNDFYPLTHWLFFHYVWAWVCAGTFALSSLAAGWRLSTAILPGSMRMDERLVLSGALGVLAFFYGVFVGGMLDAFGRLFFIAWPAMLLTYGGPRFIADCALDWKTKQARVLSALTPRTKLQMLGAVTLLLGAVAIYLQCINPHNLSYDARWYHLPIAEHYAAAGGIRRFNEGWYLGTYPQLANLIYTWALQAPGNLFDHVLICAHLEFLLFLATLGAISVLAARLLRRESLPFAAAVVFLFPELLAYDSNLNCGADHVLAFWAPAIGLTLVRLGENPSPRESVVCALVTGGALLTKYQAVYLLAPALLWMAALAIRKSRWRKTLLLWLVVIGAATTPHWLKNWVYYHDPLYPLLHRYLPSRPFHSGAEALFDATYFPKQFSLSGTPTDKIKKTLLSLVNFSFVPNDWPEFHGMVPIFGSLFTLTLPGLALLKATRRLWLLVIGVHVGIAIWYILSHQDRFLQALLPWMAACLAAVLTLTWERGALARVGVACLVVVQWAWGSDVYFFRTHSMSGDSPIRATSDFLGAAHRGDYEQRQQVAPVYEKLGQALPPEARALFHYERLRLGLGRQFVEDAPGWQGGIEYLDSNTPLGTRDLLHSMGVTHALWPAHRGTTSRPDAAREAVFNRMAAAYIRLEESIGGWNVGALKSRASDPATANTPTVIAWLACDPEAPAGLYSPRELADGKAHSTFQQSFSAGEVLRELASANVAITAAGCSFSVSAATELTKEFAQPFALGSFNLWVRDRNHAP